MNRMLAGAFAILMVLIFQGTLSLTESTTLSHIARHALESPTPTPTPSATPSPSPGVTPTPVPEPEPPPSPTPTPMN